MTSFEGESPSAVSDALAEAADPATVIADEAAERLEDSTAAEAVEDTTLTEAVEDTTLTEDVRPMPLLTMRPPPTTRKRTRPSRSRKSCA